MRPSNLNSRRLLYSHTLGSRWFGIGLVGAVEVGVMGIDKGGGDGVWVMGVVSIRIWERDMIGGCWADIFYTLDIITRIIEYYK